MLQYFQIGIVIFLLWCLSIPMLRHTPSRLKFHLSIFAMAVWLVPWQLITLEIPLLSNTGLGAIKKEKLQQVSGLVERINLMSGEVSEPARTTGNNKAIALSRQIVHQENVFQLAGQRLTAIIFDSHRVILSCALLFGIVLFLIDWLRFRVCLKRWFARSEPCDYLAEKYGLLLNGATLRRLSESPPGMATGIRHPVIWLGENIKSCHHQKTIILHELVHINNRDTFWLWFINFCKRLLWWNPLALLLAKHALAYMEYSCDEQCSKQLREGDYRKSLAELVLEQDRGKSFTTVLGIFNAGSLNVLRIKSLGIPKQFGFIHLGFLCLTGSLAITLCLFLLNNDYRRLDASGFLNAPLSIDNLTQVVEVPDSQMELFRFAEAVRRQNHITAEVMHQRLLTKLTDDKHNQAYDLSARSLAFRIMAMYLADIGEDGAILEVFARVLPNQVQYTDTHVSRILAIVNIRLRNYDSAINILHNADKIRMRLGPSTVLLAQAYHLKGDYEGSIKIIEEQLPYFNTRTNYYEAHIATLRILGKNYALLNNTIGLLETKAALGKHAPDNFLTLKIAKVKVPYVYFNYQSVAGIKVSTNDERKFPLPDRPQLTGIVPLDQMLTSASVYGRYQEFNSAATTVSAALAQFGNKVSVDDKLNTLEYLFILQVLATNFSAAEITADTLAQHENAHPLISARTQNLLNIAKHSSSTPATEETMAYYKKYLQEPYTPSLAADHEIVKLYGGAVDPNPAVHAAMSVMAFYQEHALVPDIKTLNSLTAIFSSLGRPKEVKSLRSILAKFYPRAYNFIFEEDAEENYS